MSGLHRGNDQAAFLPMARATGIADVVAARCPNATLCMDPFHVVSRATDALDEVRREVWNAARRQGQRAIARELRGARFSLWKKPRGPPPPSAGRTQLDCPSASEALPAAAGEGILTHGNV